MANYNSPFVKKVWFYSQKVLPLVFDNSLSYYEALAHFAHKVNEIINTVNNQTMHMTEWEKEIALAMEVFEQELRQIQADFEEEMESKWSDFKAEMLAWKQDIDEDWTVMQSEFSALENLIQQQIENLAADYTQYKADLTAQQSAFETAQTARQSNFETAQTNRQAAFEQAQTTRQTNYENNLTGEWEDFQEEIPTTIDGEISTKVKYFESAFGALSGLQSDPPTIPSIASAAFDFSSNIVRVYTFNRITGYDLLKRCRFGDLSTDQDIPTATTSDPVLIIFENPAVAEYFKAGITMYGSRNTSTVSGATVVVRSFPEIAKTTSLVGSTQLAIYTAANDTPGVPQPMTATNESYPATPSYDYIGLQFFAVNYDISITQPTGATTKVFPGFVYDGFSGGVIRDPLMLQNQQYISEIRTELGRQQLTAGTDLNTLSTPGNYWGNASTGNFTNLPPDLTTGTFTVLVVRATAGNRYYQILISWTNNDDIYIRNVTATATPTVTTWRKVTDGAIITPLWSSANGAVTETEYTLTDSINNFDVIYMKIGTDVDITNNATYAYTSFLTSQYTAGEEVSWEGYLQRSVHVKFNNNKFTQTMSVADNEVIGYRPKVRAIVGIKY